MLAFAGFDSKIYTATWDPDTGIWSDLVKLTVASATSQHTPALAKGIGVDAYVPTGERFAERVHEALDGAPDIVFEAVGTPGMIALAVGSIPKWRNIDAKKPKSARVGAVPSRNGRVVTIASSMSSRTPPNSKEQ